MHYFSENILIVSDNTYYFFRNIDYCFIMVYYVFRKYTSCFRNLNYLFQTKQLLFGCCDSQHLDQTSITVTPNFDHTSTNFDQLRHLKCRSLVEISTKLRHLTLAQCVSNNEHAQSVVRSVFETSTKLRPNFDPSSVEVWSKFRPNFDTHVVQNRLWFS